MAGKLSKAVPSSYGAAPTLRISWEQTADAVARDLKGIKKTISDFAIEIMNRSSTPVLPLPRLVDAIAEETADHMADPERILAEIRSRPDLFCVLDPLIGPWHRATAEPGETPPGGSPDTWVLGPSPGTRERSPVWARTAESLRYLGRRVDEDSATAVAHWVLLIERSA
jgi:hypothetical protein